MQTLTLLQHAGLPTLSQATLLALTAHVHVHFTATVVLAGVLGTFNDASAEKALAALTAQHIVVEARGFVAAYAAHLISQHLRSRPLLPLYWLTIYTHIKEMVMTVCKDHPVFYLHLNDKIILYSRHLK